MNIKENIDNQIKSGFNKEEIIANLKTDGFDVAEIEKETSDMPTIPSLATSGYETLHTNENKAAAPNTKSILMGILFIGLGITRLAGMRGGGGDFSVAIGVILLGFGVFRLIMGIKGK
jgi:predicted lipid-binding transport protein (Tim44 family)